MAVGAVAYAQAAQVHIAQRFQHTNQVLPRQLAAAQAQGLGHQLGHRIGLDTVVGKAAAVARHQLLVFLHQRRILAPWVGHDLRNTQAARVVTQLLDQHVGTHRGQRHQLRMLAQFLHRPHKFRRRLVQRDHHDGLRRGRRQGVHGRRHIDRIARHRGLRHRRQLVAFQRRDHAFQARFAKAIVLVKHRNARQALRHQLVHDGPGFVGVAGTHIEQVAQIGVGGRRTPQRVRAGNRAHQRHPRRTKASVHGLYR